MRWIVGQRVIVDPEPDRHGEVLVETPYGFSDQFPVEWIIRGESDG